MSKVRSARRAVRRAQKEVRRLVDASPPVPRAHKVEMSSLIREAFAQLRAASEHLDRLERRVARRDLLDARTSVTNAQRALDGLLRELDTEGEAETTWISRSIGDALDALRAATERLDHLEQDET